MKNLKLTVSIEDELFAAMLAYCEKVQQEPGAVLAAKIREASAPWVGLTPRFLAAQAAKDAADQVASAAGDAVRAVNDGWQISVTVEGVE